MPDTLNDNRCDHWAPTHIAGVRAARCTLEKGHSGKHGGGGCEWGDAAGEYRPSMRHEAFPKPEDFRAIGVRVMCNQHDLFEVRTLDDARDAVQYLRALAALYDALGKGVE